MWKQKIHYLVSASLVLTVVVLAAWHYLLPLYLNSELFLRKIHEAGLHGFRWDVRRVGTTGADISPVRIGPDQAGALTADMVRLDYTPAGLMDRHIKSVFVSGVEFHCAYQDGKFHIRGFDLRRSARPPSSETAAPSGRGLPFSFDTLEIRNALIFFTWRGTRYRIPLNARFAMAGEDPSLLHGRVNLLPRGEEIAMEAEVDLGAQTARLKMAAGGFHPERFADTISTIPGLMLAGELDLRAEGEIRLDPFGITRAQAALEFQNTGSAYGAFQLRTTAKISPLHVAVQSANGRDWDISASGFALQSPAALGVSALQARVVRPPEGGIRASGNLALFLEKGITGNPSHIRVTHPLHLPLDFSGGYNELTGWDISLENAPPGAGLSQRWGVQMDRNLFSAGNPELAVSGRGGPEGGQVQYRVMLPGPGVTGDMVFEGAFLSLTGDIRLGKGDSLAGSVNFTGTKGFINNGNTRMEIPGFGLSGKWRSSEEGGLNFGGAFTLEKGSLHHPPSGVRITGIDARLPLHWPWGHTRERGEFSAAGIRWQERQLGRLKGAVYQDGGGLAFTGNFSGDLLPGAFITLTGASHFLSGTNRSEVGFEGEYIPQTPVELSRIVQDVQGITMTGKLGLSGRMVSDDAGVHASAEMTLERGNLWMEEGDIAAENIRLNLALPALPALRSGPAQELSIDRISMGKIHLNNLRVRFQVESGSSVLVETAGFQWCGGQVNAQALRISPGADDYDVTLYCDRLNLADLLQQLGAAEAAGIGTVNGRIPVRYVDGKILFDDGFLYTTPGDGGTIQVTGAEMLTAGIPEDTPQYGQIDLAREALRDYEYEWVRIRMRTRGEMLVLDLQFDGKPAAPLPFVYREEAGGFVRTESGGQVSRFQGIRLNVNLELPLNRILRYKGVWDTLQ